MSISLRIALLLQLGAVITAFTGGRYFPFSDYPMFAGARKDLRASALSVTHHDGRSQLLTNSAIIPLQRYHVHQVIWQKSEDPKKLEAWLAGMGKIIKTRIPNAEHLNLVEIEFSSQDFHRPYVIPSKQKIVHSVRLNP